MQYRLSRKIVLFINFGLVLWLAGIILTPILAASAMLLGRKIAAFMYFFYSPVCHQIADRSFWLNGYPLPVCIRCLGFYLGGFFISLIYLFKNAVYFWRMRIYILLIAPTFLDFVFEKINLYTNFVGLRHLTGIMLGIAIFQLLLFSLSSDISKKHSKSFT